MLEVPMPCARVTKIALGGPDLCTAFVTTARVGLSADDLAKQPLAGSLFGFHVETPGQILPSVNLYL
jgi:D-xylonolactonase